MKQIALLLFACTLLLNQQACRSRQQANLQATDSASTATTDTSAIETAARVHTAGRLSDLGLTPDSHWRGINLGDDFSRVKAAEKGEPFESDAEHIGYTVELKNLETADMLYYQTDKKVSAIDVDLFLNSRPSVDAYQSELSAYFTPRYGPSKPGNSGAVWTGPRGETITLKDVSKGKDFGLKIKVAPPSGNTTASAKR